VLKNDPSVVDSFGGFEGLPGGRGRGLRSKQTRIFQLSDSADMIEHQQSQKPNSWRKAALGIVDDRGYLC
jgi:hypothetical protein